MALRYRVIENGRPTGETNANDLLKALMARRL